jgi:hypothetical protein
LAPTGAGKSDTLLAVSRTCGGTIVHARLDFAEHPELDPISAVAFVAFSLMRGWTNLRRRPVFHRLGLSLLALNEVLDPDRTVAQDQIKSLIRQYVQRQPLARTEQVSDLLFSAAETAAALSGIAVPQHLHPIRERAEPVIAALLRGVARWGLRGAMRWHHTIPEAEDASTIDSLIELSRARRSSALNYVMRALLADIDAFAREHPPAASKCDCVIADKQAQRKHGHVWVLLLDHVGSKTGEDFLAALLEARQGRFVAPAPRPPECDPLLVITAIDRWRPVWGPFWREPWQTAATSPDKEPIPLFSSANWDQWVRHLRQTGGPRANPARGWYPVWLDPVPAKDMVTARSGLPWHQPELDLLVERLSAGHPGAMSAIQDQVDTWDGQAVPAAILDAENATGSAVWERAAQACGAGLVPTERPWLGIPPAVMVAARLSEPARCSDDLPDLKFPGAVQALRELRASLWISTFAARPSPLWQVHRGTEAHPAVLHPWPASCLFAGLAGNESAAWDELFGSVYDIEPDPDRILFRDLAQGNFAAAVRQLVELFDTVDHRSWIRRLDNATSAPCRLPHTEGFAASYRRLAPDHLAGRTPVAAAVTSLTALLWLYRDPLTVPGPLPGSGQNIPWHRQVRTDFTRLAHSSTRTDTSALDEAAGQFESLT